MEIRCYIVSTITVWISLLLVSIPISYAIHRKSFPSTFLFGTASSAYQLEGAIFEDGRWPSIWDTFSHLPGMIDDDSNGDIAIDQYHLYQGDIEMMAEIGMDVYRFSISWPRLIPEGRGPVNFGGVKYYNNLIDGLLKHGIEPFVTLNHFDLPQVLEDEYGGWLDSQIVKDFADYAETCFELFGDRVKYWVTINEPNLQGLTGYDIGKNAPGRCSAPFGNCSAGNSTTEPYIAVHHKILSHAAAVQRFRKFKATRNLNSSIGLTLLAEWYEPLTNSSQDLKAAARIADFTIGWILNPIFHGDYPASMRSRVGSRLPIFTEEEIRAVKGSLDFVGINHYSTNYVADDPPSSNLTDYLEDMAINMTGVRDGVPIGELTAYQTSVISFYIVPRGIKLVVEYIKNQYQNPPIYITENGMADKNMYSSIPLEDALNDTTRISFHKEYLSCLLQAIEEGADVRGYLVWSIADNFELSFGYSLRFGILYVDYSDPHLKRYKKRSAFWFKQFLADEDDNDLIQVYK
ncbi:hypothetical protein SUGI_0655630 [Cryptomeria japonica]|uniref:coniferin beta-glucosidase isoform X2 n=1 Tax=Cryptomeria japonica TaxID=3369 RepID=UPI002414B873|nr:coniferin beta-glucosidase isoform X2 [Cryptomeria japonica]GLJ32581.1 hypothetical protein SUGI_0655630 [Cryptomeria japonica]